MGGSFTFTVLSLDCKACLGCLYVLPSERAGFSAQVIYWARTGEAGLDEHLGAAVRGWLATAWPWPAGSVAFPGRDQKWVDWLALPVK